MDLWQIISALGILTGIVYALMRYLYWQTRQAMRDELEDLAKKAEQIKKQNGNGAL